MLQCFHPPGTCVLQIWVCDFFFFCYLISVCRLLHVLSSPKVSPLTRSLQFISVTVALESFLLSWPIQECQPKWKGIKVMASHCAWIITGCGGHITFSARVGISLILLSAAMEFDWSLMLCSHCVIALLSRWHQTVQGEQSVVLSTCMHLITVSLMVPHLALRHLLQHSSQRHPLSFQMFTCPSKQTQTFGSFSSQPLDRKGLQRRQE